MAENVFVYLGDELADYHFGAQHPFGPMRFPAFAKEFRHRQLDERVAVLMPVTGNDSDCALFHKPDYIDRVRRMSAAGTGFLDGGDTPAMPGIFEAACHVVGTTLDGIHRIMRKEYQRGFTPIGGLHHARRDSAAGFCVFNDCGVAIEALKSQYGLSTIAYIDIDAHHGDGVYYGFEDDPSVCFVDFHEDGRFLYPGTGAKQETGTGPARGTKLNFPMPMYANDETFMALWEQAETFIVDAQPEFILLQCGADSINGDPITHMQYTTAVHAYVTRRLCQIAEQTCNGRLFAMGGGGYNLDNLSKAWCDVIESMIQVTD